MATTDENVKLNPVEEAKVTSRYLRGTIGEELADGNDHFGKGSEALLKTHGTYQQDDRDARAAARAAGGGGKAEKSFIFHRNAIASAFDTETLKTVVGYEEEQDYSYARTSNFTGSKLLLNSGVVVMNHDGSAIVSA